MQWLTRTLKHVPSARPTPRRDAAAGLPRSRGWGHGTTWLVVAALLGLTCGLGRTARAADPRPPQMAYGDYKVLQVLEVSGAPQPGQAPFTLIRNREVLMVVQNPERWLAQLFTRSGKEDPRSKISMDAPVFDAVKKQRAEAATLPAKEQQSALAASDALERYWRDFLWSADIKRWLEQSCFLVIEGQRLTDVRPMVVGAFAEAPRWTSATEYHQRWYLRFRLQVTETNKALWTDLLRGRGFHARPVTVTLGQTNIVDQNTDEMPTDQGFQSALMMHKVVLQIASPFQMTSGVIVVALLLVVFLLLATKTHLLQDLGADSLWHMSLGRTQMAFWFLVVLISYVFLWIVTDDYNTLTQSELVLIGISASTGLGAVLISESVKIGALRAADVLSAAELAITQPPALAALLAAERANPVAQQAGATPEAVQRQERRLAVLQQRQVYLE